jgi:mannan endo-1,4-beta-mannosidase
MRSAESRSSPVSGAAVAGRKLLALSEFGGVPDVERLRRFGEYWSYFVPWTGPLGPRKLSKDDLRRILSSPSVSNNTNVPSK